MIHTGPTIVMKKRNNQINGQWNSGKHIVTMQSINGYFLITGPMSAGQFWMTNYSETLKTEFEFNSMS